jgi:THO complex subunit 6
VGSNVSVRNSCVYNHHSFSYRGPWGALSPMPEINAMSVDPQSGSVFTAAGDSCAYCWDVESGKIKMTFKGHSDYLHTVVSRSSASQVMMLP